MSYKDGPLRDWGTYSKEGLIEKLATLDLDFKSDLVQAYWNEVENQLVGVIDELIPYAEYTSYKIPTPVPREIKTNMNLRNKLIKGNKQATTVDKAERIKALNKEIKAHFHLTKAQNIPRNRGLFICKNCF